MDIFDAVRARAEEHRVPGVAVGVLEDGEERHEAFGVTSLDNPLPVTPETRFQVGSISKTFAGTAILQLVDSGVLDLDRPVRAYLPDLRLADAQATERVTLRHLLSHTGGWVGDWFDDTGWGDDALERYVERMDQLAQLTPVGELWSYNNAGFALAGRVVEVATGKRFEDVVQELVLDPLELASSTYWPWEVMTERFVVGHDRDGETVSVARPWPVGRSAHPAGGIVSTTPDLLRYARLHLDPPPALAPMQEPQAAAAGEGEWVGLTWYGEDTFGTIRHGGGTMGQLSLLVLQPKSRFAMAVLTNQSPYGLQVIDAALGAAGLRRDDPQPFAGVPIQECMGTYEMIMGRLIISPLRGQRLLRGTPEETGARIRIDEEAFGGFPTRDTPPPPPQPPAEAFFFTEDRWLIDDGPWKGTRGHFIRGADGEIAWLRVGGRLYKRI